MKRSGPLKRYKRLECTKPMNRTSAKKRKEKRDTDGPRRKWRESVRACMICDRKPPVHTHEIARGGSRCKAVYKNRLWLALCGDCHDDVDNLHEFPVERQLAYRMAYELRRACQDLNDARLRAPTACTTEDVYKEMADVLWP